MGRLHRTTILSFEEHIGMFLTASKLTIVVIGVK
jgi:hypothetical protein